VELARNKFPDHRESFIFANAFYWAPARQYDFVRTNLEYVPQPDWIEFIHRQYAAVAPGGRLIVCYYRDAGKPHVDPGNIVEQAGYAVVGGIETKLAAVWIQRPA